jgi:hypothetical protein
VTRQQPTEPDKPSQETAPITPEGSRDSSGPNAVPDDPARAFVLGAFHALVGSGTATWTALESGDVLLTCSWGIVLHLGKDGVTRIR